LDALAQHLAREDPRLVKRLQGRPLEPLWMALVFGLLMLATVGGGLALIALGVAQNSIVLMGLGIAVTAGGPSVAGVWLRDHQPRSRW
jgi:hypothetical protein